MENVVFSFLPSAKKGCEEGSGMNVAGANPRYLPQSRGREWLGERCQMMPRKQVQ